MGRARDLANILSSSGNVALDSEMGLTLITPTSITATGGSGTISATGTVSLTTCTAISLNGCFTSTYDNYRVIFNLTGVSTGNTIGLKYRVGGTDTSTLYYAQATQITNAGNVSQYSNSNTASIDILPSLDAGSAGISFAVIEFINPLAVSTNKYSFTTLEGRAGYTTRNGTGTIAEASKSYDGFTLLANTGNMTAGTISVYGYRK
jgi:hypothetical protein